MKSLYGRINNKRTVSKNCCKLHILWRYNYIKMNPCRWLQQLFKCQVIYKISQLLKYYNLNINEINENSYENK